MEGKGCGLYAVAEASQGVLKVLAIIEDNPNFLINDRTERQSVKSILHDIVVPAFIINKISIIENDFTAVWGYSA